MVILLLKMISNVILLIRCSLSLLLNKLQMICSSVGGNINAKKLWKKPNTKSKEKVRDHGPSGRILLGS